MVLLGYMRGPAVGTACCLRLCFISVLCVASSWTWSRPSPRPCIGAGLVLRGASEVGGLAPQEPTWERAVLAACGVILVPSTIMWSYARAPRVTGWPMAKVAGLKACGDSTVLPLSKGGYAENEPIDEHGFAQAGVLMTSGCLDGCLVGSVPAAAGLAAGPTPSRGPVLLPSTLPLLPWWPCKHVPHSPPACTSRHWPPGSGPLPCLGADGPHTILAGHRSRVLVPSRRGPHWAVAVTTCKHSLLPSHVNWHI